jgi:hypothetical protein
VIIQLVYLEKMCTLINIKKNKIKMGIASSKIYVIYNMLTIKYVNGKKY